jgi:pantothenate kinase type III
MVRVSPFVAVLAGAASMVQALPAQVVSEKRAEAGELRSYPGLDTCDSLQNQTY